MNVNPTKQDESDEHIAHKVQEGDKDAFGALVDRYEQKLLRYGRKFLARREDIEDIVQDVFMSAYKNIKSFDTTQRFSPWIYRIAHNAFVNGLRRNERSFVLIDFDTLSSHPVYEDPTISEREIAEMRGHIDQALVKLSPKYREVLALHYFEELPYKDIAEILEVPVGTVGIRIKRAKEALKKEINHYE